MLHQQRAAVGLVRCEQQVHVIGHEAVGVDYALELRGHGLQVCEVEFVVGIGEEAGAAVVAALNDVDRHLGDGDPGTTGPWRLRGGDSKAA
jgi:hypothetical protein